ncbi:hypothetical protein EMCG_02089 [[Emmonsia] crescens]|uniref:Knr4/Smi1-like domain-containing protein n=1 Tax=[Emmonsia] crescens TaxID=73230 RepID=A0A0G2HZU6_9EURO|nr:hypothetical protein EMCG_02089 [Emmonsia crescens UAMH 3008]
MASETQFSRRKLLQSDDSEFVRFISSRAQQFAVLGYIDVAINLVSRLNTHEKYCKANLQTLWLLWASLGEWPVREEEKLKKVIKKKKEESKGSAPGRAEGAEEAIVMMKDVHDEIQAMEDGYAGTWFHIFTAQSGREQVEGLENKDISNGIQRLLASVEELEPEFRDASTGAAAMEASARLVSALDLRWLLKERGYEQDGLISVGQLMDMFAKRMEANQQLVYLMQSRRAWGALKDGTLAKTIGVNDQKVYAYANELEETLDERIREGRMKLDHLTMRQMLEILDNNTRTNPESLEDYIDGPPKSLLHDPASVEEIAEAERKLGIKPPADYKEFLAVTDGFEQSWGGIISDPPLHPVRDIRWLEDDEDYFIDLELELLGPGFPYGMWPTVGKALEIGSEDINNVWLIPPPKVQEVQNRLSEILKSGECDDELKKRIVDKMETFAGGIEGFMRLEWCLVTWASGGAVSMMSYPSFTAYTRQKVKRSSTGVNDGLRPGRFFGYQCR